MYLKVKYRCDCGCVSEFDGSTSATRIFCANCGNSLPDEDSAKILAALKNAHAIPECYDGNPFPTLMFVTDPSEFFPGNRKET